MRVAVLGCGPAGLMAAHAAKTTGARVDIYSRKRKSEMFGCQYLHAPIPGMTDVAPVTVRYHLHGDAESYRRKVYGDGWDGTVSPEDLLESHDAWDIRRTYDNLWAEYGPFVFGTELSAGWVGNFMEVEAKRYDLIINSVPRPVVCRNERHAFPLQKVWAAGDAPERGMFAPIYATNNSVVCKATPHTSRSWKHSLWRQHREHERPATGQLQPGQSQGHNPARQQGTAQTGVYQVDDGAG
jgi:hypothetical protein